MAFIASLLARRRGLKSLNVGGRIEGIAWPAVAFRVAIASILSLKRII